MAGKKGELTSKQLITIIILIVSFSIILLFFFMLNLKGTIDKESCRNSVILRGALPFGKDAVSLKCKTQNVCLSMGGNCNINRENLVTIKVSNEEELTKEMVNLLFDCWWMMGEGKVDYMSGGMGFHEPYCSICSRINFDDKIREKYPQGIEYSKLYEYMRTTKVPEKDESYLFNLYKLNSLETIRQGLLEEGRQDIYDYKLNSSKEYVIVTAIVKDGWAEEIIAGVSTAVVVAGIMAAPFFFGQSLWLSLAVGASTGGSAVGITILVPGEDTSYLTPIYLEFNGKELEALDCEEYVTEYHS